MQVFANGVAIGGITPKAYRSVALVASRRTGIKNPSRKVVAWVVGFVTNAERDSSPHYCKTTFAQIVGVINGILDKWRKLHQNWWKLHHANLNVRYAAIGGCHALERHHKDALITVVQVGKSTRS